MVKDHDSDFYNNIEDAITMITIVNENKSKSSSDKSKITRWRVIIVIAI